MNKEKIKKKLLETLHHQLLISIEAANNAHIAATDEQSIPETQYDTLAIEASYLAEGQSKRISSLKEEIQAIEEMTLLSFDRDTPMNISALIQLTYKNNETKYVFIVPSSGGVKLPINNTVITCVTHASPLAQAIIGRKLEDDIEVIVQGKKVHCYISACY